MTLTRHLDGDAEIVLVNPSPVVARLLSLTGVDEVGIFRVEESNDPEPAETAAPARVPRPRSSGAS